MEQFLAQAQLDKEVELFCLGGSKYSGRIKAVALGVVTLEWEDKESYIACDKIIAVWPKEDREQPGVSLGFFR